MNHAAGQGDHTAGQGNHTPGAGDHTNGMGNHSGAIVQPSNNPTYPTQINPSDIPPAHR